MKTSKNTAAPPYTILLVGETGVGKSSVLQLIANVLIGNDIDQYDFNILEHTNEQGGAVGQSQTHSARLYELTSKNGIVVSACVCGRREHAITTSQGPHPRHAWFYRHSKSSSRCPSQGEYCDSDQGANQFRCCRPCPCQWHRPWRNCWD